MFEKLSISIIPERHKNREPTASAFVRLILPYGRNTKLSDDFFFSISENDELPCPNQSKIYIIQRDMNQIDIDLLAEWLLAIRNSGGKSVLELDDDFFNEEGLRLRIGKTSKSVKHTTNASIWMAEAVDAVVASTPQLYQLASQFNNNVFLVPNYLDPVIWELDEDEQGLPIKNKRDDNNVVKFGYIGTPTHDDDLKLIVEAIKRIESEYGSKVEIEVIGAFQKNLDNPLFGRAVALPKNRSYPDFVSWLQSEIDWDFVVIPLVDDLFNKSKSNLKFLECSALGLPSICSDVETYEATVKHHKSGILVQNTTESWYLAIKKLIDNPDLRGSLSKAAFHDICNNHTTHINSKLYKGILYDIYELPQKIGIPKINRTIRSKILIYIKKYGGKNARLYIKLITNPHKYFSDSKHSSLRILKFFFKKDWGL